MKTTGIVLVVLGLLSTIVAIIGASNGHRTSFGGITFVILGAFLISRAEKKKEGRKGRKKERNQAERKEEWSPANMIEKKQGKV